MTRTSFKLTGLKALEVALDPARFDAASKKALRRATQLNGKVGERSMRQCIRAGVSPSNAALTQALKGGDKPLVDSGELFQAIASEVVSDSEVFIGVLRTNGAYNVAEIVHEGATIGVTAKMRGMFFYLWKASIGEMDPTKLTGRAAELFERFQDWKPLLPSTTAIVIPARRFSEAILASDVRDEVKRNWETALITAFRERANEGRSKR